MTSGPQLRLYNTLTRSKDVFTPIDPGNVRMYVCGPTVYDYAHIGNARPAIVFDVLFRVLRHVYGADHVTYVRNITDVDDKINARAARDFPDLPLNEAIRRLTETTAAQYQDDVKALGCLAPTVQPRATEFVLPRADGKADMTTLIQNLIERGHAYAANGEILFDAASMPDYGRLSQRRLEDQQAGARIAVDAHKKNPEDFVLWKASSAGEPGWPAHFHLPEGEVTITGRPGWHIECSAMSAAYLGEVFDIHGGGLDLIFPHHENEIAQSRCAHGTDVMANVWMHNGFLQVEGRKMSKSEGNFITIHELLETEKFGGHAWQGGLVRWAMMKTHYRQPLDFTLGRLVEAQSELNDIAVLVADTVEIREAIQRENAGATPNPTPELVKYLSDDLDVSGAIAEIHRLRRSKAVTELIENLWFLGITSPSKIGTLASGLAVVGVPDGFPHEAFAQSYKVAVANSNLAAIQKLDEEISDVGGRVELDEQSFITLRFQHAQSLDVQAEISARLEALNAKNFAEADRIRAELLTQGVQLMDFKDPVTGERRTKWELKR